MVCYIIEGLSYDREFRSLEEARDFIAETIKEDNFFAYLLRNLWKNNSGRIAEIGDYSVTYHEQQTLF